MLYEKEVDPTELQTPPRNCVENRLLTFGKKYAEKKLRLKETFYQDMMKDRPQITRLASSESGQSVFKRLYQDKRQGGCQTEIEKIVKKSQLRVPLNEIIKGAPYNPIGTPNIKNESFQHLHQDRKYLGTTFSQSQKLKQIRQFSGSKQQSSMRQCNSQSIIQLSMDLYERKRRMGC